MLHVKQTNVLLENERYEKLYNQFNSMRVKIAKARLVLEIILFDAN